MKEKYHNKLYSLFEFYRIVYLAIFSSFNFISAKRKKLLTKQFTERIMIAVTEVNGCAYCSYAHTKMALESGMSEEEIQNMFKGVMEDVPKEEIHAVVFGQHYAESRGRPSKKSWEEIVEIYGLKKAKGILGAIRIMMFGNAQGIAWGSFLDRFKKGKKKDPRSNIFYELGMMLAMFIYPFIAIIHVLLAKLFRRPAIKFKATKK